MKHIITEANCETIPSLVIVDPIDGTTNHAAGLPVSAVMAAHYAYGKASCAGIYDRMSRRLYACVRKGRDWEVNSAQLFQT